MNRRLFFSKAFGGIVAVVLGMVIPKPKIVTAIDPSYSRFQIDDKLIKRALQRNREIVELHSRIERAYLTDIELLKK